MCHLIPGPLVCACAVTNGDHVELPNQHSDTGHGRPTGVSEGVVLLHSCIASHSCSCEFRSSYRNSQSISPSCLMHVRMQSMSLYCRKGSLAWCVRSQVGTHACGDVTRVLARFKSWKRIPLNSCPCIVVFIEVACTRPRASTNHVPSAQCTAHVRALPARTRA